ncbi:glycosyltransferase [Vicingaceae bacterium]|nr:glycosyltransferase [Vicingaceae bacterium]
MTDRNIQKKHPLVSIITVNYNTAEEICDLIDSILNNDYKNIEIIVVDNASPDNDTDLIKSKFPQLNLIMSTKNLGFAGGNNLGIKQAKGDYLFFVNSDAIITNGTIQHLIATFNENKNIGIVSPKFHLYYEPGKFDYAGCSNINSFTGRGIIIGQNQEDKGQYNTPGETFFCHGGGMLIPKALIEKVGLIPDNYFLYYEEMEWCENIRKKGYKVYYQPKALIRHKVSKSIGLFSTLKTYYLTRNRILFMRRNKPVHYQFIFYLYMFFISIPKNITSLMFKGQFEHLKYFVLAILWNFGYKTTPKF